MSKPITEAELQVFEKQVDLSGLEVRLTAEVRRLHRKYENKCKCGKPIREGRTECWTCADGPWS